MPKATQLSERQKLRMQITFLKLQHEALLRRYERYKKRNAFVQKNSKKILALSMEGWPRTKHMKDYIKWLDLIFEAKMKGIYSIGTSNCDVIANLNRFAKELK